MIDRFLTGLQDVSRQALARRQKRLYDLDGTGLVLHGPVHVSYPDRLKLGYHVVLNEGCYFETYGGLTIGSHVHIARCCTIYTVNHNYRSSVSIPYDSVFLAGPVWIADCVWIGANVSVVPGVSIGEGAIVGMGAVVTQDIPDGAIVGGNPARVIGYRDLELYQRLKDRGRLH